MVLVKNWPFSHFLILVLLGRKNVFYDILQPKNAILGYKNKKFKKSKKLKIFSKGLVHGFGQKLAIFPFSYFSPSRPGKCLLRYSRTKNAILGYKNKKLKKSKKLRFLQRGRSIVLVKNWPFFHFLYFRPYRPGKFVLQYSRKKTPF